MFMTSPKDWPAMREAERALALIKLRDEFAKVAIRGLAGDKALTPQAMATIAYDIADAMIVERKRKGK